jgi:Mn2+/Fe2+ NRAMP family transporter
MDPLGHPVTASIGTKLFGQVMGAVPVEILAVRAFFEAARILVKGEQEAEQGVIDRFVHILVLGVGGKFPVPVQLKMPDTADNLLVYAVPENLARAGIYCSIEVFTDLSVKTLGPSCGKVTGIFICKSEN